MDSHDNSATGEDNSDVQGSRFADDDPDFIVLKETLIRDMGVVPGPRLGTGTFSVVMRAERDHKEDVAIKIIDTREGGDYVLRFLPREKRLVGALKHVNVVRTFDVVQNGPYVTFISELCEGGDLLQKILAMQRIPEIHSKVVFRQLTEALTYLQSLDIIHRDLKCENVFLDINDNVKLGDFGFARVFAKGQESNTFCGSRAYVAPEVLSAIPYTGFATDIWSAGVVLYVMVSGLMPFDDRDPRKMIRRQNAHKIKYPKDAVLSTDVRNLINDMLHPVPGNRPTAKAICNHSWLNGVSPAMRNASLEKRLTTH